MSFRLTCGLELDVSYVCGWWGKLETRLADAFRTSLTPILDQCTTHDVLRQCAVPMQEWVCSMENVHLADSHHGPELI